MRNWQQWGYRLFFITITTALAFALGWLGSVAANYYTQTLQRLYFQVKLSPQQQFLVDLGFVMIGVLTAFLLGSWFTQRLWSLWETLEALSPADKIAALFGAILGLALAYLVLLMPLMLLRGQVPPFPLLAITFAVAFSIVYFAVHTLLRVRDAISLSFPQIAQILRSAPEVVASNHRMPRSRDKLLDTSVIIDGRLADIVRTGFIEGRLLVPSFVLNELQMIADSEDELRRARGRRGLAVLETLKSLPGTIVEVVDAFSPEVDAAPSTDLKLVRLAKELGAAIITNDNNLQKIAELQGVPVLCVNELATALKPVVLPGEELTVILQRAGKEPGQGVGYLDDGTMVVVERGRNYLGHEVKIKVTSVLQSPVGKMIFGDFKEVVRRNVVKVEGGDLFDDDFGSPRRRFGQKA
jgi:uncharacterized protein YacL